MNIHKNKKLYIIFCYIDIFISAMYTYIHIMPRYSAGISENDFIEFSNILF